MAKQTQLLLHLECLWKVVERELYATQHWHHCIFWNARAQGGFLGTKDGFLYNFIFVIKACRDKWYFHPRPKTHKSDRPCHKSAVPKSLLNYLWYS